MAQKEVKKRNYNRFWMLLNETRSLLVEDKEEVKRTMVHDITGGRTDSLKELTQEEYDALCNALEQRLKRPHQTYNPLKRARSAVLHKMQLLGIDTADWNAVDRFCRDRRIAGKRFCRLDEEELQAVYMKCLMIAKRNEGIPKPLQREESSTRKAMVIDISEGLQGNQNNQTKAE